MDGVSVTPARRPTRRPRPHTGRHLPRIPRVARFGETVMCVHCESDAVVKRGTTDKDAQQYWCKACKTYFNDLTYTLFGQHHFSLEEMFYIAKEMRSEPTAQIARDLDRDDEAVLNPG